MIRLIGKISWKINISTFNSLFLQSFPQGMPHWRDDCLFAHFLWGGIEGGILYNAMFQSGSQ